MSVPTPQEWRDLQARLARIEKHLTATADSIPPDYGTANAARRGLMSREQAAALAANTTTLAGIDATKLGLALDPPRARVKLTAAQATAHATMTPLSFGAADGHNTTGALGGAIPVWAPGAPTRLTALRAGVHGLGGGATFAASVGGALRLLRLRINGAATAIAESGAGQAGGGNSTYLALATEYYLAAGDYLEVVAYQDSGGSLNVTSGHGWLRWLND